MESLMSGETDLSRLLATMRPKLSDETYVFVSISQDAAVPGDLQALMSFREDEGLTMIVSEQQALAAGMVGTFKCRMITLMVHSSLNAIGFLAAITTHLATAGISINPVSAFFHDHLFIPTERTEEAAEILRRLAASEAPEKG
jgi:hypothetical protein